MVSQLEKNLVQMCFICLLSVFKTLVASVFPANIWVEFKKWRGPTTLLYLSQRHCLTKKFQFTK
jgi:intracellular septation protein A